MGREGAREVPRAEGLRRPWLRRCLWLLALPAGILMLVHLVGGSREGMGDGSVSLRAKALKPILSLYWQSLYCEPLQLSGIETYRAFVKPADPFPGNTSTAAALLSKRPCFHELLAAFNPLPSPHLPQLVPGVEGIFILHNSRLRERKEALLSQLSKSGLAGAVTWVDWVGPEFIKALDAQQRRCLFRETLDKKDLSFLALNLAHFWVQYHTMVRGLKNVIIMEDDAAFCSPETLNRSLAELVAEALTLDEGYSIVQLSGCPCGQPLRKPDPDTRRTSKVFGPGFPNRCSAGYLLSLKGATALVQQQVGRSGLDRVCDQQIDYLGTETTFWSWPYLWFQACKGERSYYPPP